MGARSSLYLSVALLLVSAVAWAKPWPVPLGSLDRAQLIAQYFRERTLDSIEGIWLSSDNQYEIAIVRNQPTEFKLEDYPGYDYVGVIIQSSNRRYQQGELKCLFRKTADGRLFPGIWFMGGKQRQGTTFVLLGGNRIEYLLESDSQASLLIRSYPEGGPSASGGPPAAGGSGTGFFVANDLVATNYHVIAGCKDIRLTLSDGAEVAGTVVVGDEANDVALIRTNRHLSQMPALPLGDVLSVQSGCRVYTVGFPLATDLGVNAKVSEGIVSSLTGLDDDPRMYQISTPIQPGNSGGPLLDGRGCVIGIVTSSLDNGYAFGRTGTIPQNVNFAMKANYLDNLLAVVPGGAHASRAAAGQELTSAEIMAAARPAVVLVRAKG